MADGFSTKIDSIDSYTWTNEETAMSTAKSSLPMGTPVLTSGRALLLKEFQHLRSSWPWFFCFGVLLVIGGTAAIVFPTITFSASVTATIILGAVMMVAGVATIIAAFWAGKWSGVLLQLLVGILYL